MLYNIAVSIPDLSDPDVALIEIIRDAKIYIA